MADKRLYVGNLPNDTTERDLQKIFKKYGVTTIELKKISGALHNSTFAYINIPTDRVTDCLEKCRSKNFKNSALKIEVAKESFLERLKKEREKRNDENASEPIRLNPRPLNNVVKNKKIVFADDDVCNSNLEIGYSENDELSSPKTSKIKKRKSMTRNEEFGVEVNDFHTPLTKNEKQKSTRKHFELDDENSGSPENGKIEKRKAVMRKFDLGPEDDHSDDEIPRKRNLPMFRGTVSIKSADEPKADFSMKRFEEFSDVWRDSSPERDMKKNRKIQWKSKEPHVDAFNNQIPSLLESNTNKQNPKNTADLKRLNALQEKWNVIKEKKETIKKALKNLETNRKKIKFSESNDEKCHEKNDDVENRGKKVVLFEDDASDDDFQPNFNVQEHLAGKNGLKFLKMKSNLAFDDRFKLDDRFCEDSYDSNETRLKNEYDKRKESIYQRSMIRYDPDKDDHKTRESQPQTKATEKKKKAKKKPDKNKLIEEVAEKTETPKPEVSKAKHYSVTDSLKNAFKKTDEKSSFSLSAMFDEKIQKDKKRVQKDEAVPLKKAKSIENIFENASSSDDENDEVTIDEEEPMNVCLNPVPSEKVLGKCGVWGETFFFQPNDSRLQEAVSFYKVSSKPKQEDFDIARSKLKSIVRKKLQNSRRDKRLFKQKIGGKSRVNKSKFQKRLNKARL